MGGDELVPVTDEQGQTVWVTPPPDTCPNGHPLRPGDITTYGQGGYACWCDGARTEDDGHSFHNTYTCKDLRRGHARAAVHRPGRGCRLGRVPRALTTLVA
jgi:hypothetical protein